MKQESKELTSENQDKKIKIDWGRQGGIVIGYIVILLGFHGIIANIMLIDELGNWISFIDMDRTILFWTYNTFISPNLGPILFVLILTVILALIIIFSLIDWNSFSFLLLLIPLFVIFVLDLYWNLFDLISVLDSGKFYLSIPAFAIVLLFFVTFALTFKEDIPEYGIKASIWLIPFIIILSFFFYTLMFGFSIDPFIYQFFSVEGWLNILILVLTVIAGSLSGMKVKQIRMKRKEI